MEREGTNTDQSAIDEKTSNQIVPDPLVPGVSGSSVNVDTSKVDTTNKSRKVPAKITKKTKDEEVAKVNVVTFCRSKNYSRGIQSRLEIFLQEHGDQSQIKTLGEWEQIYSSAMKRITK